jgi:hypothetical protein
MQQSQHKSVNQAAAYCDNAERKNGASECQADASEPE